MKVTQAVATVAIAATLALGAVACDGQTYQDNGDDTVAEVVYGHTVNGAWIEYGTPEIVYVSPAYYHSHMYLYRNPLHVHYTAPRGVVIGKSRTTTTTRTTSRGTKVTSGCSLCRPGGGGTRYGSGSRSGSSGGSRSGRR